VQQPADVVRHLRAPRDRQRTALAEVVLHVDDDQRALHDGRPGVQHPVDDLGEQVVPELPHVLAGAEVGGHVDALLLQGRDEAPVALHQPGGVLGAGGHVDAGERVDVGRVEQLEDVGVVRDRLPP
jgi:hypothetical protein